MAIAPRDLLRKLRAVRRQEWVELGRAQLALVVAQWLVWTRRRGRLIGASADETHRSHGNAPRGARPLPLIARRLEWAVDRAARYGPFRPSCLVRAVALQRMLERAGVRGSRVNVGVKRAADRFEAHAWIELDGRVLGDHPSHVRTFAELASVRVMERR